MEISELKEQFSFAKEKDKELRGSFDFDNWSQKLENLKQESTNPEFWNDNQNAQNVLRKISRIEKNIAQDWIKK